MQFNSPKNFKRGRLILNQYRVSDLLMIGGLIVISFILAITYASLGSSFNIVLFALCWLPSGIGAMMLIPYGIYHNLSEFILLALIYLQQPKSYIWEGVYKNDEEAANDEA